MSLEVKRRIMIVNRDICSFSHTMRFKLIYREVKVILYQTFILPILTHGSESWNMDTSNKTIFKVYEGKILW